MSYNEKVLDHGHVQHVTHMGSDLMVCNAARVSFNKETDWEVDSDAIQRMKDSGSPTIPFGELTRLSDKDKKLIKYLAKHNHWTPFAHPQITLRIKAPVSVRLSSLSTSRDLSRTKSLVGMSHTFQSSILQSGEENQPMVQSRGVKTSCNFL